MCQGILGFEEATRLITVKNMGVFLEQKKGHDELGKSSREKRNQLPQGRVIARPKKYYEWVQFTELLLNERICCTLLPCNETKTFR